MSTLLQEINEYLAEASDISDRIPYDSFVKIKKLIKKGAEDPEHDWSSALDLVNRAFQVMQVDIPDPSVDGAWDQYEEAIEVAVKNLQKATELGIRDDSWQTLAGKVDQQSSGGIGRIGESKFFDILTIE